MLTLSKSEYRRFSSRIGEGSNIARFFSDTISMVKDRSLEAYGVMSGPTHSCVGFCLVAYQRVRSKKERANRRPRTTKGMTTSGSGLNYPPYLLLFLHEWDSRIWKIITDKPIDRRYIDLPSHMQLSLHTVPRMMPRRYFDIQSRTYKGLHECVAAPSRSTPLPPTTWITLHFFCPPKCSVLTPDPRDWLYFLLQAK